MQYQTLFTMMLGIAGSVLVACSSAASDTSSVSIKSGSDIVSIENRSVRIEYDLRAGTYKAIDKLANITGVSGASVQVDGLKSTDPGLKHTWTGRDIKDRLGKGRSLVMTITGQNRPVMLFEASLYENSGSVILAAGIKNTAGTPLVVHEFSPLAGADGFPGVKYKRDVVTLNGTSGASESFVTSGFDRQNENSLLATFIGAGKKRSIVWGGLTYKEFAKYASVGNVKDLDDGRQAQIASQAPDGYKLTGYLRAWTGRWLDVTFGKMIRRGSGGPYQFPGAIDTAEPWFAAASVANDYIQIWAAGLKKDKSYMIGFTWWDFDGKGRKQSVVAESQGKNITLLPVRSLPNYTKDKAMPEEVTLSLPVETYQTGHAVINFKKESGTPDAVLGEFWIYESDKTADIADAVIRTASVSKSKLAASDLSNLTMKASDPRGKLVDPGKSCGLDEKFYLDFTTANPFEANEKYGLAIRTASGIDPDIYDFPTVCAWYASGSHAGCPYVNHTKGMVEEAEWAEKTGFTKYSPAAVRVVPDVVGKESEQGWWDDEHWRKHGHYVEPYETSEKYCNAVTEHSCLPFTYVHTCLPNQDFLGKNPQWALGYDPEKPAYKNTGYDFSNPGFQEHIRKVWKHLRDSGMKGVMFDYPGSGWQSAGFYDKYMTTGSFYRKIFELSKEGLGPDSYVHERLIGQYGQPQTDITIGCVDSQRTEWDTHLATPEMYTKCGLRWYKNRVIFTYDMDAKNFLNVQPNNRDGLRQMLTMAYTVAPRLVLATSFRSMKPDDMHDLTRIYPIHKTPKSARPLDAFTSRPFPRIYDFDINPKWHQLAFCNYDFEKEAVVGVEISKDSAFGGMGLDSAKSYYAYDFWNDRFLGKFAGSGSLEQTLRPGEVRMMSVHEVMDHPQFISTNRHIMQGYLDLKNVGWDKKRNQLKGTAEVVGGETYKVVIAANGLTPKNCSVKAGKCRLEALAAANGLYVLSIDAEKNTSVDWSVSF